MSCHQVPKLCKPYQRCVQHDNGEYECICNPGYHGGNCMFSVCDGHPCKNWGTCFAGRDGRPECSCALGYTGSNCEIIEGSVPSSSIGPSGPPTSGNAILTVTVICVLAIAFGIIIGCVNIVNRYIRKASSPRASVTVGDDTHRHTYASDCHQYQEPVNAHTDNTILHSFRDLEYTEPSINRVIHLGYNTPPSFRNMGHIRPSSHCTRYVGRLIREFLTSRTYWNNSNTNNNQGLHSRPQWTTTLILPPPYSPVDTNEHHELTE
ncbi:unnamed protein product, partial [Owenia fusiformis]